MNGFSRKIDSGPEQKEFEVQEEVCGLIFNPRDAQEVRARMSGEPRD